MNRLFPVSNILFFFLAGFHIAGAQQFKKKEALSELAIGKKVPELIFNQVFNYKSKRVKFSNFKTQLTILDFWSTSCSSCIQLFPHMQELQNEFKGKLQILLVNGKTKLWRDDETKARRILDRIKMNTGVDIRLPIIFNSSELDNYFPWKTIPHEVWIDSKGVVIAITGSTEVNSENIKRILAREKISLRTKHDLDFDLKTQALPELIYGINSTFPRPIYSSTFVKGMIDGLGGQTGVRRSNGAVKGLYTGWFTTNMPLIQIYKNAFRDQMIYPNNRIFFEVNDKLLFSRVNYSDTSYYSNVWSYDITLPPSKMDDILCYVQNDLQRTFRTAVKTEKRRVKCIVLKATDQSEKYFTKGGERKYEMDEINAKKYIRNYPFAGFIHELNASYFNIPLVDETGLTVNIDIDMPYELTQENIIKALKNAGFEITEEERELEVVVITDN